MEILAVAIFMQDPNDSVKVKKGNFLEFFFFCTLFNTASDWDRAQDCCDFDIDSQTL
jgi:hypothetical protein